MTAARGMVPSLDAILKAHAAQNPDTLALIDPPDCEGVTGEQPRRLTFRQADRAAGAIAARLCDIGLARGAVVGMQMPNTVASIVMLLGIMRAGMVAAPLPLLWRRADCVAALSAAGARAIVTCGRVAGFDHGRLALDIAAELFPIRAVCGFGCGAVDGIVPFDDLLSAFVEQPDSTRHGNDARAAFAVLTFDTTADAIVPVARDMAQLLAGGRLVRQRGQIEPGAIILSTIPVGSYAGMSAALVPWLLSGGTLVLHHPCDPDLLREQIGMERCTALVVPDAILGGLSESGLLDASAIHTVISVWRAPERLAGAAQWTNLDVTLVDVAAFGETALLAARRPPGGRTLPWPVGPLRIANDGPECAHVTLTPAGTLGIGGTLAASAFTPFNADSATDATADRGPVDTGYPCRPAPDDDALIVTAPPAGLIAVGGYRFMLHALQQMVRGIDVNGVLAALPHALCGHRLAGHTADAAAMRDILQATGANPLLTAAFRHA